MSGVPLTPVMFTYLICVLVFVLPCISCVPLTPSCLLICSVYLFEKKSKKKSKKKIVHGRKGKFGHY